MNPRCLRPVMTTFSLRPAAMLAALMVVSAGPLAAEPAEKPPVVPAAVPDTANGVAAVPQAPVVRPASADGAGEAQRYCQNIAAAAADARYVWQTRRLTDLQAQVTDKISALEAKTEELKELLARRDEALKRASAALVSIYAKMKPDTAAAQLAVLDEETAAAMLQQLNPRLSSAILDEMQPDRAARLVGTMTGTLQPDGKKS